MSEVAMIIGFGLFKLWGYFLWVVIPMIVVFRFFGKK